MGHHEAWIPAVGTGPGFDDDQRFPIPRIGSVADICKQALLLFGRVITLLRFRLLQHRRVSCQTRHVADHDRSNHLRTRQGQNALASCTTISTFDHYRCRRLIHNDS